MLIVKIQNDGTGTPEIGNYRYQVMVNNSVIESGFIAGHKRAMGWRSLVSDLIEESKSRELSYIREYHELLKLKGEE